MKLSCVVITILWAFIGTACERGPAILGQYEAFDARGQSANLLLRLEANGRGSWASGEDYVEIRWKTRGSKIVMHTQSGGVFEGIVSHDQHPRIKITLDTIGSFEFKKAAP